MWGRSTAACCGTDYWLREFIKWGTRPESITGANLLSECVVEALRRLPEAVRIQCGNAAKLAFPTETFDLKLQSTVYSSVLDPAMKEQVASEMLRVVKEDGLVLWYDYHINSP
jgi:ubiquinone/menaquinone biosynthesis C-methylase UbiE